jgi:hypothetical protein
MPDDNKIALDPVQFETLRGTYQLVDMIMKNPEAKLELQNTIKKHINKDVKTDADIAAPHVKPILDRVDAIVARLDKRDTEDLDNRIVNQLAHVKDTYSLTDDGVEKLKKYMVDKKIADPEDAYFAWNGRTPPEPIKPSGISPGSWGFGSAEDDASKAIWDDGAGFDAYVQKIWNENR